jgi:hypothetical protein
MPRIRLAIVAGCCLLSLGSARRPAAAEETRPLAAEVREHRGRPTLFIGGRPEPLVAYSPAGHWRRDTFAAEMRHFLPRRIDTFFVSIGQTEVPSSGWNEDFFATPLWTGDEITAVPAAAFNLSPDEQADTILSARPDAKLFVRFFLREPASWRTLHSEELFIDETGTVHPTPSLASAAYWDAAARFAAAVIEFCESRPWAHRIVGYANFLRMEGTHEPLVQRMLYDHGPAMTARWRTHLRQTYGTVERLREAHGDPMITFETAQVPTDPLRGPTSTASTIPYWQPAKVNQPLRDYLLLQRELFHDGFRAVAAASRAAADRAGRRRVLVYDSHKQSMLGWDNIGFFDPKSHWPLAWPDEMTGSGLSGVAGLFDLPGFDGLITPHDYQARGLGGVFEPEGSGDTAVLRGRLMLCEMDTRTWAGTDPIAAALTGFSFEMIEASMPRRTLRASVDHPLTRGLSPATVLGGPLAYGPVLLPTDGTPLGVAWTKQGRNLAGLAVKEQTAADGSTWTSVFSSTPGLPAAFWRNAARLAGAHVWCETDEVVLADAGLVAIHSLAGGPRRLLLPRESDVVDLVTGRPVAKGVREIHVTLAAPDTRAFRLLPEGKR